MIQADHICFHYRGGKEVLRDVGFCLENGQFMAVLGNNGAGKSTLLKCLGHILRSNAGSFSLDGENLFSMPRQEIAKRIAFVSQAVPDIQMTVHDVVMLGRRPYMRWGFTEHDHEIVHQAMRRMDIEEIRGRFVSCLSGGERQKVMLARALAQEPHLLLLDEPTSSLDIRNQYHVLQYVRDICHKNRLTAIVVIHDLNLALRFCDRFLLLKDGEVYKYGDHAVLDSQTLKDVYQVDAEIAEVRGQKIILVKEKLP